MEYRKNEIRAGIVILTSFVILVVMLVSVSDLQGLFKKRKEYKALFSVSEGLEKNASVRYAGIRIGRVKNVRVVPELGGKVEITLEVYAEAVIKEDARASIKTLGLVGRKHVEVSGGSPAANPLAPGGTIQSDEALKIEDLTRTGMEIATKVKHIAVSLDRLLGDPALSRNIKGTLQNVESATQNIKEITESKDQVSEAIRALPEIVKKLDANLENLKAVMEKTEALLGRTDALLADNRKQLDEVIENSKQISGNLKELTDDVKKHPWKLIRKP
jgi:phospholipid/cholesterol/gamma-HCH transport system substrate-binding protein